MNGIRSTACFLTLTLVGAVALVSAGPALAAPVPVLPDAGVWQTDGRVDSLVYSADGGTLYLAGLFHHLCPPAQAVCNGTGAKDIAVDYLAAIKASTGAPILGWKPSPNGEVDTLALAANGILYAGGVFDTVSGQNHRKVAAITAATGVAIAGWRPVFSASVKAIALSPDGSVLYAGGTFVTVDAAPRTLLAAVSTYSTAHPAETLLPWAPNPSGSDTIDKGSLIPATVNTLVVRPGDGLIYAAGVFTSIGGLARTNVAALSPADPTALGAAVDGFSLNPPLAYVALNVTLTRDGSTIFLNGRGPGGFVLAADSTTGHRFWARHLDGDVQAAVATDTVLFVGGHFDFVSLAGTSVLDERHHLAAFDTATGKTDPWNPRANSNFGVNALAWSPGHISAGGDFTQVQFAPHSSLVQFSGGDSIPPAPVQTLTATSTTKGRVDLTWLPTADSDSSSLSYRVYRRPVGGTYALITTVDGASADTSPTALTYSDTSAVIGSSYEYQVRAADPVFLSPAGNVAGPLQVVGDQSAPGMPTDVLATSPSAGNAVVAWNGAGDGDDATLTYTVTRHAGALSTTLAPVTGPSSGPVTLRDTSKAGGTFTYTVRASDGTFTSPTSPATTSLLVKADPTTPKTPTGLTVTSPSPNTIVATWAASSDPEQTAAQISYSVYRKLASVSGGGTLVGSTAGGQTTFTETTDGTAAPLPGRAYTYYVSATDGPNTSARTAGVSATVTSLLFTDPMTSLSAWTLPATANGVTLDTVHGHLAAPSAHLVGQVTPGQVTPILSGYASRSFGAGYPTACVKEYVSLTGYDLTNNGQTTLLRLLSTAGNDIARLYVDHKGLLWVRSDWGSAPSVTAVVVPADGTWHSVQLCVTTTPTAVDGSLTAYYDALKFGPITGVDNSPDPIGSVDIGDRSAFSFTMNVDDVSAGTSAR